MQTFKANWELLAWKVGRQFPSVLDHYVCPEFQESLLDIINFTV